MQRGSYSPNPLSFPPQESTVPSSPCILCLDPDSKLRVENPCKQKCPSLPSLMCVSTREVPVPWTAVFRTSIVGTLVLEVPSHDPHPSERHPYAVLEKRVIAKVLKYSTHFTNNIAQQVLRVLPMAIVHVGLECSWTGK